MNPEKMLDGRKNPGTRIGHPEKTGASIARALELSQEKQL
jgi:hypothetical protein